MLKWIQGLLYNLPVIFAETKDQNSITLLSTLNDLWSIGTRLNVWVSNQYFWVWINMFSAVNLEILFLPYFISRAIGFSLHRRSDSTKREKSRNFLSVWWCNSIHFCSFLRTKYKEPLTQFHGMTSSSFLDVVKYSGDHSLWGVLETILYTLSRRSRVCIFTWKDTLP